MDTERLTKLFELVAEVGWDCQTIVDPKTNSIRGAIIGSHDIIDQLTCDDQLKELKIEDSDKDNLEQIYQKMIMESHTGFWIGEVSDGKTRIQSYHSYPEMVEAAIALMKELTIDQFDKNIKINTQYSFSLISSDGTAILFPSEELANKIYQEMRMSVIRL